MSVTSTLSDPAVPPVRTALIVLGMHRSGTSALAGVLGHLGATLPRDLMAPSDMNAKGFFESNRITGLNERLLSQAGFSWWDPRRFPAAWFDTPKALSLLDEAVAALRADYGDALLFVIKDPRTCRLMPFWRAALARFGARVMVVHTHRGPWDVAASLTRWADYETEFGLVLWARHVLDAEADSRDLPRSFTCFDALMDDWRATVTRIADDLGLVWPVAPDAAAPRIEDFLSRDLQHFRAASETGPDGQSLPPMLDQIGAVLAGWVAGGDPHADRDRMDRLRLALDEAGPLFDRLALRTVHRAREVRNLTDRIADQQTRQRAEIDRIMADRQALVRVRDGLRADLDRAGHDATRRSAEIADLQQRVVTMDRRLHVALVQLRQFTEQRARDVQERMRLAIALDDPSAMSDRLSQLAGRVERATAALNAEEARLRELSEHQAEQNSAIVAERDGLQASLARAQVERDDSQRREAALLSSTSWRVTGPLRALSRVARRLRP